ncbi:peptide chain release factor H [Alkalilimnicola ehrlichii]|uniref:Peptide chain release factor H n=1 Tax=Alkalilimnicola ehrlichii TaxID=351052 RepID=A0A3E0X2V7_9GAMM|nr:peptide chain release factor H [Alkalilimnicola ehrlichii]RFA25129.1 peptide chain release factor H [Alkalilimnicola ehrlichii]RFA38795.1 peptide chain release factor H [Alkalilimnicola ehrlichii]
MILLQLSAAQGPAECCRAVANTLPILFAEAATGRVAVQVLEQEDGPEPETLRSVLLSLEGDEAKAFAGSWEGTIQWIFQSPYRPGHKRKNWFIGGQLFETDETAPSDEIRFEACRASGPGGQHVNKTDSAIRAVHVATGLTVKVQSERSQHANKRVARMLLQHKLNAAKEANEAGQRAKRNQAHKEVERGSPIRVFSG